MTEEEYFRKNYPDSCYGDRPLSPYWDFFQDGVEFGERQSEKKIEELELELAVEKDQHQEETNLHLHAEEYIKSLEQKLEQTEKDLTDYQFNYPKIKELEKENAELKGLKDVATLIRANNDTVVTLMQLNNKLVSKSQQLTKAKEIIKDLLRLPYANDWEVYGDVTSYLDKAEQFLKEIEK